MTIGQRIAQMRKENNLSQEALGEALGVSRQSISKWESNNALPEIEKLIAMSKLFSVSVGWLLGVEETEQRAEADEGGAAESAPEDSGELSEQQLKMVEEIVSRYIAAQPKPQTLSPRRRRIVKVCVVAAAVCLAMGLFWLSSQMDQMENQYNNLQYALDRVTDSVNSQINGIGSRVEEILQSQNNLTADYAVDWVETDIPAGTVTIRAWAVPKTYREGMTASFLAVCGGETLEIPAELMEGQTFSATFDCPLVDDIQVSVVFLSEDLRETQFLQDFYDLYYNTVPVVDLDDTWCFDEVTLENGNLNIPTNILQYRVLDTNYYGETDGVTAVTQVRMGLFKNRELVAWGEPIEQPENYRGFEDWGFAQFDPVSLPVEQGDTLCYALVVTDEYGRTTVRGGEEYAVTGATGEDGEQALPTGDGNDSPSVEVQQSLVTTGESHYYAYDDPADWGLTGY